MRYVQGCGNPNAKLMVVGEAPGAREEEEGIPFVGTSGRMVDDCLTKAGIDPCEVYKTNVCKVRPPNNEIFRLPELGVSLDQFIPQLWKEVAEINPNCILAFGNTALKALTGVTGIKNYRGSILPNSMSGLPKVVGSIHPASLLHAGNDGKIQSPRDKIFIEFDVKRAVEQSLFRELRRPDRTLHIAKNSLDLVRFIERNVGRGLRKISYDIETFKAIPMCVGFAFSRYEAISVPLFDIMSDANPEGIPMHDMVYIWELIADILLDSQYQLIGHNLKFDQGRLEEIGFTSRWPYFDTQLGFHTMYPELPKKLAFISSVVTEEPYYKDELEEYNPKKEKLKKRLIYNARDCAVTYEVYEKEIEELGEMGMLDWYFGRSKNKNNVPPQQRLHQFYYQMEKRGILISKSERRRLIEKYKRYTIMIHKQNTKDLGYELNVFSNGLKGKVAATIFGDLKCPLRKDTSEETLEMLMLNAVRDERRTRILKNILKERKARKTRTTYVEAALYDDGKMRTVVNITGTESGRTSTSKPKPPVVDEARGIAFQTLTKHGEVGSDLRKMYIPRPGYNLIEGDGSQAEARVVALLARDEVAFEMMNKIVFKKNKHGIKDDIHTYTTMMVMNMDFDAVTDEERQIGKKTRHAGNYKMGKRRFSLLAQISEWRAGKCLERFHQESPKISLIFWEEIIQALRDNGQVLVSPHGRRRTFFDKWGEDMFKEAFSFIPQAAISDHTKFAAIRVEQRTCAACIAGACDVQEDHQPWIEMLQESHDSFLAETPIDRTAEAAEIIRQELEVPIDFSACSLPREPLVIPCEIQIGSVNWKRMEKYTMKKAA